eukprot:scaffold22934_cov124-Skeletonema_marinoi.AAC.1
MSRWPLDHPFAPPDPICDRTPRLKSNKRVRPSKLPVSHASPPPQEAGSEVKTGIDAIDADNNDNTAEVKGRDEQEQEGSALHDDEDRASFPLGSNSTPPIPNKGKQNASMLSPFSFLEAYRGAIFSPHLPSHIFPLHT